MDTIFHNLHRLASTQKITLAEKQYNIKHDITKAGSVNARKNATF